MSENNQRATTLLWPLPVLGKGTVFVESLASYCARLATAHHFGVHTLFRLLIEQKWRPIGNRASFVFTKQRVPCGSINRKYYSEVIIDLLNLALGRSDLSCLALGSISTAILSDRSIRIGRAWCSCCLASDSIPYDRLLWTFLTIDRCPIHEIALSKICPFCMSPQWGYPTRACILRCSSCRESLVYSGPGTISKVGPSRGESDLCELIAYSSQHPDFRYPSNVAERFLLEYKKGANRNRRLYRSPIFRRKGPGRDARLKTMGVMLDAAASVGVSLHQLLIDPEASARSMPLEMDGGLERTPKGSADVNRKVTSLRMALEAELQKNTDEPATQILEICKQQGVRVQFSRYWLPALTNQLACRNEKLRSQALHKKYADAEKWVFDIGIPGILKGQWSSAFHAVSELRASKSPIADIVRKQFKAQIEKMPDDEFNRLLVAVKEHWEREKPSAMSQWAAQANKRVERRSSALKEV